MLLENLAYKQFVQDQNIIRENFGRQPSSLFAIIYMILIVITLILSIIGVGMTFVDLFQNWSIKGLVITLFYWPMYWILKDKQMLQ